MSLATDKKLWIKANKAYNTDDGTAIMTDAEFDALERSIRNQDPDWAPLHQTGAIDGAKEDVTLPHFMPSLDKHYEDEINDWADERTQAAGKQSLTVIMDKLDGSAIELGYRDGKPFFMATRGNGTVGGNISFLLPFIKIPKRIPVKGEVFFRCEAVMTEATFNGTYSVEARGAKLGKASARATVAGILNRNGVSSDVSDLANIDLVVLGVFGHAVAHGLSMAHKWGFKTVKHSVTEITNVRRVYLDEVLTNRLDASEYAMDGLVVGMDRRLEYSSDARPTWMRAYKRNVAVADAMKTVVLRIQWDVSHAGKWTPTAQFKPIMMGGVTVSQASLYSAQWMRERGIGPGATVKVIRAGEVIPKVVDVVVPAQQLQWPEGDTEWRGAYLYSVGSGGPMQRCKRIERFLEILEVEDFAIKSIITAHDGGIDRIWKLLDLVKGGEIVKRFRALGIGPAKANRLIEQKDKLLNSTMLQYVLASSCFEGVGKSRFAALASAGISLEDIIETQAAGIPFLHARIKSVYGFDESTADAVIRGLASWNKFWPTVAHIVSPKAAPALASTRWRGCVAAWTGYRSAEQEKEFAQNGGTVATSVTKNTTHLFTKDGTASGSKGTKAKQFGVDVTTWADFNKG